MKLTDASYKIIHFMPEEDIYRICLGYCICYNTPVPETYEEQCKFVKNHRNHESPLEHSSLSVLFTINRGVSHELVRHRHTSYSQQSTRYCNYSKDKFDNQVRFINDKTVIDNALDYDLWIYGLERAEKIYLDRIQFGAHPEQARGLLPNDVATKLLVTTNFREWINIFNLRCDTRAHYQMREIMRPLHDELKKSLPCVFDKVEYIQ